MALLKNRLRKSTDKSYRFVVNASGSTRRVLVKAPKKAKGTPGESVSAPLLQSEDVYEHDTPSPAYSSAVSGFQKAKRSFKKNQEALCRDWTVFIESVYRSYAPPRVRYTDLLIVSMCKIGITRLTFL